MYSCKISLRAYYETIKYHLTGFFRLKSNDLSNFSQTISLNRVLSSNECLPFLSIETDHVTILCFMKNPKVILHFQ